MKIPGSAGIKGVGGIGWPYPSQEGAALSVQKEDFARRFDSVSISAAAEDGSFNAKAMELRGKLHQEVRAAGATPLDTISTLREQVSDGSYQIDAAEIAKKMLLLGGIA